MYRKPKKKIVFAERHYKLLLICHKTLNSLFYLILVGRYRNDEYALAPLPYPFSSCTSSLA